MNRAKRRLAAVGVAPLLATALAGASISADEAAYLGGRYLVGRQHTTGAFFSATAPADQVAEVLAAAASVGALEERGRTRALAYLERHGEARARQRAPYAARIVLGLRAVGGADRPYRAILRSFYDPVSGRYDTGPDATVYGNALALLGVVAAGDRAPERTVAYLKLSQCRDGGFSWRDGCLAAPDVDTSAVVIMALRAAGLDRHETTLRRARDWLRSAQNDEGGFGLQGGGETNANSTGLALSALAALGEDPRRPPWSVEGGGPIAAILRLQLPSGGFRYIAEQPVENDYATVQAVPGAARLAYPLRGRSPRGSPAVRSSLRQPSTSEQPPLTAIDAGDGDPEISAVTGATNGRGARRAAAAAISPAARADPPPRSTPLPLAAAGIALSALALGAATVRLRARRTPS